MSYLSSASAPSLHLQFDIRLPLDTSVPTEAAALWSRGVLSLGHYCSGRCRCMPGIVKLRSGPWWWEVCLASGAGIQTTRRNDQRADRRSPTVSPEAYDGDQQKTRVGTCSSHLCPGYVRIKGVTNTWNAYEPILHAVQSKCPKWVTRGCDYM